NARGGPLERGPDNEVAREPVSLGRNKDASAKGADGLQRPAEALARLDGGSPANTSVKEDSGQRRARTGRPRVEGGRLGLRPELLSGGRDPHISHGEAGISGANTLRHAENLVTVH